MTHYAGAESCDSKSQLMGNEDPAEDDLPSVSAKFLPVMLVISRSIDARGLGGSRSLPRVPDRGRRTPLQAEVRARACELREVLRIERSPFLVRKDRPNRIAQAVPPYRGGFLPIPASFFGFPPFLQSVLSISIAAVIAY
jgi:hypothetical protein